LYEALYGYRPFRGDTLPVLANAVITGRVEPPPRGARAPSYLRKAVLRGLSVRREERHPSMQALVDAIARDPRRRLRRWLLVLALVLLAVLAALVVDRRRDRNAQLCADGPARLVGVWDDARREAIAAAFLASGQPYAQDTLTRVEARIDAYARAWQEARATACLDTRVHGVASEALLDLRMRCYDRRLAELRALTAALADADALAVESAVDVVRGLPALAACADAEALTAAVPLPEDPALQAAIAAVDDELAEIYATTALGRYHEASERIAALADRARALEHAPLVARVLAQQASVLSALGEYAAAERVDLEAAEYAARGREDDVLVRVWSQLVTLVGDELARPEEGIVYAGVARAAAARAGNKPWDERRVATAEGTLLYTLGRYEQAVVAYRRALELDRALEAEDDPEIARGMNNLANALDDMGEHAEAVDYYRRALAIFERALGPGHPDVSKNLVNLGSALEQLGRSAEALPHYQRALEINERVFGVDHLWIANPHCHIGLALAALGRDEAATSHLEKALAVWERELGAEHPLLAYALVGLGQIARREGALDRADALLLRALALRRAGLGEAHPEVAETLGELAEVAVERGDFTQALAHLGEALTIAERELSPHHHKLARLRLLEARALWGDERGAGDPIARDRARRSAARAREALRAGGRDATDVERWIAAHP
ncbi:MAG: tetratricopeptide repeat protein, partial [Myxococcales bacterium]|nr:tetratricopeptide repeat protein [Myxococcales bacterium]